MTHFYRQHPNQQWLHGQERENLQQGYARPLPTANPTPMYRQLMIAREQVPGQVVKAEIERSSGRLIFEVDVISQQGVKYEVKIDATTGEAIQVGLD